MVGERYNEFKGTALSKFSEHLNDSNSIKVRFHEENNINKCVLELYEKNLIQNVHDISYGGPIISLFDLLNNHYNEQSVGLNMNFNLMDDDIFKILFSENGGYVIAVKDNDITQFEKIITDYSSKFYKIGSTNKSGDITLKTNNVDLKLLKKMSLRNFIIV